MGFMGHYPFLKTPNLDRIRKEGTHLKNAFATLSMCAPSRASFLTGTYPHVHGVNTNVEQREYNPDKTPSFPMVLQAAGYKTAFMGKWHMDHSTSPRRGFDHWISFAGQGKYHGNKLNIDGKNVHNPGYITDELNKYALNFIRSQSESPFCLYLSHKAVHQPWDAAPRHKELYKGEVVPHQDNFKDNLADKPSWQKVSRSRDKLYRLRYDDSYSAPKRVSPKPYSKENGAHPGTKEYLRCIASVDDGIGLIYDLL
jgi:N-acetylglucosamine-6-sulfatase